MKSRAIPKLIDMIRETAQTRSDPLRFIRELQLELQKLEGAEVSFCSRNLEWFNRHRFLEDRAALSGAQQQAALCAAAAEHRKTGDIDEQMDHVSASMFDYLDLHHPCYREA